MRNGLVAVAVAAVLVVALIDATQRLGDDGGPGAKETDAFTTPVTGAGVPIPEVLPGTLTFAAAGGCRLHRLDFTSVALAELGVETNCRAWVSPDGDRAVVSLGRKAEARTRQLALMAFTDGSGTPLAIGAAAGEVNWSRDSSRVAWCTETGDTVVFEPATEARFDLPGCSPSFTPTGSVLTRPLATQDVSVWLDGQLLLREDDLRRGLPGRGPIDIIGYDMRADELLAVAVAQFRAGALPKAVLELWKDGQLQKTIELPALPVAAGLARYGELVEFSPDGNAVATSMPGYQKPIVVADVRTGLILLPPHTSLALRGHRPTNGSRSRPDARSSSSVAPAASPPTHSLSR